MAELYSSVIQKSTPVYDYDRFPKLLFNITKVQFKAIRCVSASICPQ